MSVRQFPDTMYIKVLNDQYEPLGRIQTGENLELTNIVLSVFTYGTPVGAEKFRLNIFSVESSFLDPIAASSWVNLSELGSNKYGRLRFDFDQQPMNANLSYYLVIESDGYTKTGSFYVGAKLDWPDSIYGSGDSSTRGAQIRIIGYK